jgi:zona occludens toxin (predicted ATPase)
MTAIALVLNKSPNGKEVRMMLAVLTLVISIVFFGHTKHFIDIEGFGTTDAHEDLEQTESMKIEWI